MKKNRQNEGQNIDKQIVVKSLLLGIILIGLALLSGYACNSEQIDPATANLLGGSQQALSQENFSRALFLADSAIRRAPKIADAHFQRGRVLSELSRFSQAQTAYQKTLMLDPSYDQAWLNLGNNASRQQQYRRAINFYQKAQKGFPVRARVSMGRAYNSLGKPDSAEWIYRKAIKVDSSHASAYIWLSLLYEEQGKLEKALEHSRHALSIQPKNIDYMYIFGKQLMNTGEVDKAVNYLKKVVKVRSWHYGALYKLGQALANAGRAKEAQYYLDRADSLQQLQSDIVRQRELIKMAPNNLRNWTKLAKMLKQAGRHHEAKKALQAAKSLRR